MRKIVTREGSVERVYKGDWFQNLPMEEVVGYCKMWAQDEDLPHTIFENDVALYDIIPQEPLVIDLKKENPDNGTE